ncbi:MAG TPA: hypothetical protein PLF27_07235 [Sedimentibacter sp.]|nr:hypothetical protein [Sedimentibacter sp.]
MSNVTTIIKLGAAVLITIAAIAIAVALFGQGADVAKNTENDIKGLNQVLVSKKFEAYNNTEVSGSNVINAIRMYAETGTLTVTVKTKAASSSITYDQSNKYTIDPSNVNYINPVGNFTSTLTINANGVVTGISFTQH